MGGACFFNPAPRRAGRSDIQTAQRGAENGHVGIQDRRDSTADVAGAMEDHLNIQLPGSQDEYLRSSFYEQLVDHVFISELLQEAWFRYGRVVEVLRSEVDATGFDIALECAGVLRHVQLKTSRIEARTGGQKVALALGEKPSGCVIWILRDEDREQCRMRLRYLFFGSDHRAPLPDLLGFKVARHTKGNSQGVKKERPGLRVIPKSNFRPVDTIPELLNCSLA